VALAMPYAITHSIKAPSPERRDLSSFPLFLILPVFNLKTGHFKAVRHTTCSTEQVNEGPLIPHKMCLSYENLRKFRCIRVHIRM